MHVELLSQPADHRLRVRLPIQAHRSFTQLVGGLLRGRHDDFLPRFTRSNLVWKSPANRGRLKYQAPGQQELFTAYRYHAVFTDSPFILAQAEAHHRGHAVIEQVNADLINGPLAHLPSGRFAATPPG